MSIFLISLGNGENTDFFFFLKGAFAHFLQIVGLLSVVIVLMYVVKVEVKDYYSLCCFEDFGRAKRHDCLTEIGCLDRNFW